MNTQDDLRGSRSLDAYSIGPKLRTLRQQKSLTLSRLAAETGLSTALISKLENNRMVPTIPTLLNISSVFGVGLSFFFAEPTRHSVCITRKVIGLGHEKSKGTLKSTPLNLAADARLVASVVEFGAGVTGTLSETGRPLSAVVHVIDGTLQFRLGSGVQEVLETGDCVCLETEMLITWSAIGKESCRALVVTPQ